MPIADTLLSTSFASRRSVVAENRGVAQKLRGGKSYDRTTSATALLLLILAQPTSSEIGKDRIAENNAAIFARTIEIIVVPCAGRRSTSFRVLDPGGPRPTPRIAATAWQGSIRAPDVPHAIAGIIQRPECLAACHRTAATARNRPLAPPHRANQCLTRR